MTQYNTLNVKPFNKVKLKYRNELKSTIKKLYSSNVKTFIEYSWQL